MARTTQQQLDALDERIAALEAENHVSYSTESGRSAQYHNLDPLYKERTRLEAKLARESGAGRMRVAKMVRPRK